MDRLANKMLIQAPMKSLWCCLSLLLIGNSAFADPSTFSGYLAGHGYFAVKTIEPYNNNHQYVRAFVNGHDVLLCIDTGSPCTCLTYQRAKRLGLAIQPIKGSWWGVGGPIPGQWFIAPIASFNLAFGAINHTSAVIVLPKDAELGDGADGLLGADYMVLNAAIFPVGSKGILFRPGPAAHISIADYMTKSHFTAVPMTAAHGGVWVTAYLYGKPLNLKIDSGADFTNFRKASVAPILGAKDLSPTALMERGLDGRRESSVYFTPDNFTLGHFDISHQTFLASDSALFNADKYDGLAGFDLLGKHKAVIDFASGNLWLR